jgi:transcriptional regulator with XRE-family HTH domain
MEFKVARIRKGLSRKQLAQISGMCTESIAQMERGQKDGRIISFKRIADALGMSMKEFV